MQFTFRHITTTRSAPDKKSFDTTMKYTKLTPTTLWNVVGEMRKHRFGAKE
jgi:hypothetical protein